MAPAFRIATEHPLLHTGNGCALPQPNPSPEGLGQGGSVAKEPGSPLTTPTGRTSDTTYTGESDDMLAPFVEAGYFLALPSGGVGRFSEVPSGADGLIILIRAWWALYLRPVSPPPRGGGHWPRVGGSLVEGGGNIR